MRRPGGLLALLALIALFSGPLFAASASPTPPAGWAVLIENDWYGGRYPDLPVGYANSTRVLALLMRRGWPSDHILLLRDKLDANLLQRAGDWLARHARPGDTALLYIAGEYRFFEWDLHWQTAMPELWKRIPTSRRVLIIETCFAERLAATVSGIQGLALPAVGSDEWDLWGLPRGGGIIQGGAFTYYLARALAEQPLDAPLAFDAAFAGAVAETQQYFREVVSRTPAAINSFHVVGSYPEALPHFPNPHLVGIGERDRAYLPASPPVSSP